LFAEAIDDLALGTRSTFSAAPSRTCQGAVSRMSATSAVRRVAVGCFATPGQGISSGRGKSKRGMTV
jgi:hypothetical protein